jgi:hypothetical protein
MFRIIIILIILAGTPSLLMAQSEFVENGENAIGLCGSYSKGAWGTHIGGLDLGFSIGGRFDFGFLVQVEFHNDNSWLGSNKNNVGQGFYIDGFPVKQKDGRMPLSIAIGVGYITDDSRSSQFASVALMRYFRLSKNIRIQPIVSGSYIGDDNDEGAGVFQVSLPISARSKNGFTIFAGPVFISHEDYRVIGISMGMQMKLH